MNIFKDKYRLILIFIMILAIVFRIVFISKTDISKYQFDVGIGDLETEADYNNLYKNFDKGYNEGRHINYIMQLYKYNSLPNKIIGQFYHPPLHHFIMANWLKLMDNFSDSSSFKLESMQWITLFYSIIILVALYKLLDELEIDNKNKIIPLLLYAFYPIFVFLSGSINNDELVIMFSILVLLYLVKWEKNPNIFNTVIIATFLGLGLMTKTSIAVMIIPAVYVYFKTLAKFVNENKSIKKLLIELLVFTIISGIFGLWFQIRSLMNNLNTLGIIQPYETLYIGNQSIWNRFGLFNIFQMSNVNIWNYFIYSSINLGILYRNNICDKILALLAVILIINSIYYLIKNKNKMLIITYISWWLSYIILNLQMPYICSMNARYMLIPISINILQIGKGLQTEKNKFMKTQVYISSILFIVFSVLFFI